MSFIFNSSFKYIWQSSEIYSNYSPTFAMKIGHNTTLILNVSRLIVTLILIYYVSMYCDVFLCRYSFLDTDIYYFFTRIHYIVKIYVCCKLCLNVFLFVISVALPSFRIFIYKLLYQLQLCKLYFYLSCTFVTSEKGSLLNMFRNRWTVTLILSNTGTVQTGLLNPYPAGTESN